MVMRMISYNQSHHRPVIGNIKNDVPTMKYTILRGYSYEVYTS